MGSKFNVKSHLLALIVLDVIILQNSVRTDTPEVEAANGPNTFEIQNTQDFTDKVLNSKDAVLAQFHAPWCTPCKALSPSLENAINEHNGKVRLARIDVAPSELGRLARKQGIRSIPVVASYKDGKCVDKMIGLQNDQEVRNFVNKQLVE